MNQQNIIFRRVIPAELMNELFSSLPLGSAFGLLTKMPNGLLARNVQKMLKNIKEEMKNNLWNEEYCGPKVVITEDGLVAKQSDYGWNSLRAVHSIPIFNLRAIKKPIITSYFEMQILNKLDGISISLGYCGHQFPLEGHWHGYKNNSSFGLYQKGLILFDGKPTFYRYEGDIYFEKGDFVGIGIIYHPNSKMECFATWNGQLLVKARLREKFTNIELFPSVCFYDDGSSIRVNFGKVKWQFKNFKFVLG